MDLSALSSTLPPGLAEAEREMGDKFRAAAMSVTHLYKSSLGYTKQAYQVGYSAALADVLSHVQSSMSANQTPDQTLARLMDWAEARQTAMAAFAAEAEDDQLSRPPSKGPLTRASQLASAHAVGNGSGNGRPASAPPPSNSGTRAGASGSALPMGYAAAQHTRDSMDNQAGPSFRPSSLTDHRYDQSPHPLHPSSSAGPSSPIAPRPEVVVDMRGTAGTMGTPGRIGRGGRKEEDPDRTFVSSTPGSPFGQAGRRAGAVGGDSTGAGVGAGARGGNMRHAGVDSEHRAVGPEGEEEDGEGEEIEVDSPTVRQPRPTRSPLRYRSDLANTTINDDRHYNGNPRGTGQGRRQTQHQPQQQQQFNPALPPLPTLAFTSTSLPAQQQHDSSAGVPIGSKRPAPTGYDIDLDPDLDMGDDLDVAMGEEGDTYQHPQSSASSHDHENYDKDNNGLTAASGILAPASKSSLQHQHQHQHHAQAQTHHTVSMPDYRPVPVPVPMSMSMSMPPVTPTNRPGSRKRRNIGIGGGIGMGLGGKEEKGDDGGRKGRKGGM